MPKHLSLDFLAFVKAVSPEVMESYFASLATDAPPRGWPAINGAALEEFLSRSENAELDGLIRQDFRRMNDLANRGFSFVRDAYERFGINFDPSRTPEELSMRLLLANKEAWDFAWSRYLLLALDSKVSIYSFPASELKFGQPQMDQFQERASKTFLSQAKGSECEVRSFELDSDRIIYVKRGFYVRPLTFWQDKEVQIKCYRPVLEDVVVFDSKSGELLVKASQERERTDYVRLFAHCFAGDMSLGETALRTRVFDLSPVAQNSFSYAGEGPIVRVDLVGVRIKLPFAKRASLQLFSPDIFETLGELPDVSLDMGELALARFRFSITDKSSVKTVTFEVAPPARTDLPESGYTSMINAYLNKQGVRLL
jgi:hypothetical protein